MLYVNNIRAYYNILKWLTANEEIPESDELDEQLELFDLPQSDAPEETV